MLKQEKKFKVFCVVGTRPEFIKMYPVYKKFWQKSEENRSGKKIEVSWVLSSQHTDMLVDLEKFFKLKADFSFGIDDQHLDSLSGDYLAQKAASILQKAAILFSSEKPDLLIIQGDTLTAQQCALAGFYQGIPIAHVEAGIRTNEIKSPFPEELSRRIISQIADLNFAPGARALNTLEAEKILFKKKSYNFLTGNTVVDTLDYVVNRISEQDFTWDGLEMAYQSFKKREINLIDWLEQHNNKQIVLITAHRRESFGEGHLNLANALLRLSEKFRDTNIEFVVSLHKNQQAREPFEILHKKSQEQNLNNIHFFEAINYPLFVRLMQASSFIVTDSGGIQEEAPYLSKPVLIFRNETERTEGIDYGMARLVGTEEHLIHGAILELLTDEKSYYSMIKTGLQPYGDGLAAERIAEICLLFLREKGI
jgi:UDP-N-acetylglucosamine 2-epimerase (non-hydrolysing)